MNKLDRLLELEFEQYKVWAHLRKPFTEDEQIEYNSLKSEIQALIEDGETYRVQKDNWKDWGIFQLESQIKDLSRQLEIYQSMWKGSPQLGDKE